MGYARTETTASSLTSCSLFPIATSFQEDEIQYIWPETGYRTMALVPMNLRLEAADGSESEEYRIHGGDIEVRRARRFPEYDSDGQPSSDEDWQTLTAGELSTHVQENSLVAQWLRHRIGWRRLILACADQQTRATFGIEESVRDRFAA